MNSFKKTCFRIRVEILLVVAMETGIRSDLMGHQAQIQTLPFLLLCRVIALVMCFLHVMKPLICNTMPYNYHTKLL